MKVTFEGTAGEILDQMEEFVQHFYTSTVSVDVPAKFDPPCPTHDKVDGVPVSPDEVEPAPADLQAACMAVVNGDKAKKKLLVEILGQYDCATVNGLPAEYRDEFWSKVKDL